MAETSPIRNNAAPIAEARVDTDEKLQNERECANSELEKKTQAPERRTDATLDHVRAEADQKLDEAKRDATQTAEEVAPAKPAHAKAVVAQVADRAQKVIDKERERVDEVTERERQDRKRAFLDVLARERHDTDGALGAERAVSDELVNSRDEMLAMISHDLRNLLHAVVVKVRTLHKRLPDEAPAIRGIESSLDMMGRWAEDLVDIAELDTGFLSIHRGAHDPVQLLEDAAGAFTDKAKSNGVTLAVEPSKERPLVDCDRERIGQVLANLFDNALKFTPAGGRITARVDFDDSVATFSVADTGPGIAEQDRGHVFDRRWQARPRRAGGSGLGLYISKRVIDAHGGKIWLDDAVSSGAKVCFSLPFAEPRTNAQ